MRRFVFVWIIMLVLGLNAVGLAQGNPDNPPEKVSKPFTYSGYTAPQYKAIEVFAAYVPLSDGEKLAVDVYLPQDGPERTTFPVILGYTPYQRSSIDPNSGKIRDLTSSEEARFFLSYGYAVAYADMRGTGASTGWLMDFMPRIAQDGKELVDWIAAQPWCDGNVGMYGGSYVGWSQTAVASQKPAALKCIVPAVIPLEGYTGEVYPGGIYVQGFLKHWSEYMYPLQRNYYLPDVGIQPAKPVIDEDGDGDLADEIPVDANGNGGFLDDGDPPTYRDGVERKHVYYEATRRHDSGNYDYASWAAKLTFIDARSPLGPTLYELGPNAHVRGMMESGIPIYNLGGWFDGFTRGSFELQCTLRPTNPSKLLMVPGYHGLGSGPFWEFLGEDRTQVLQMLLTEHLRFFDRYLKGIENGVDLEPPIYIYVMNGGGWRFEDEWPLKRQVLTRYYFDASNCLSGQREQDGADTYAADFTHSSTYGTNGGNRWLGIAGESPDQMPDRTEKDKQCLIYTSPGMDRDTEVTGHPIVRFWVSSTAEYGDFFVYLEDVDENGEAILVTEGQLRAGFAALRDNDRIIAGGKSGIDVLPDLPWHGYEKADYTDRALAGGAVVALVIDFHPTSWVFRKGHRIRVAIACADYPTYQLHPKLSTGNDPGDDDNIVPTITVYRDDAHPSHVELPVIPASAERT
ncbi:MAG: CocE/NonD family hydrolase [Armatimonadota bacterium]|nr:MAG: CocE/NonD family hydrolase [Armatimonadota bacterium]